MSAANPDPGTSLGSITLGPEMLLLLGLLGGLVVLAAGRAVAMLVVLIRQVMAALAVLAAALALLVTLGYALASGEVGTAETPAEVIPTVGRLAPPGQR
jgi:hypothetical protein